MKTKKPPKRIDKVWEECLRMWRWIASQVRKGNTNVHGLKKEWLKKNDYVPDDIAAECFFCERAKGDCSKCPGRKIEPDFNCADLAYHYANRPIEFYNKLRSLNRKRLAKRKRRNG